MDSLAVQALIRLLVKGGGAIPIAADEPVGAQRAVEAVHILLVTLRTVLAEINIIYIAKNFYTSQCCGSGAGVHK